MRVPVIFEIEGEEGFRDRETRLLRELAAQRELLVATGGGIVMREENRNLLANSGTVIYLSAEPQLLYERTRRDTNRPLLNVADPLTRLQELHAIRDPLYRGIAHLVVQTQSGSVGNLVKRIEMELAACEC